MEPLLDLLLALGLVLTIGKVFEAAFQRGLHVPGVMGLLILGLIIGNTFLKIMPISDVVEAVAWFGIILLLFYAGLETRFSQFMRNVPRYALVTICEAGVAFTVGYLIGISLGYPPRSAYFLGCVLEATSVSLSVRVLIELGKLTSIEGYTILGVAALDDLAALITIVAGASLAAQGTFNIISFLRVAIIAFMTWLILVYGLRFASNRIALFGARLGVEESLLSIVLGVLAIAAFLVHFAKLSPLVAAYAIGLAFSEARGIRRVSNRVRTLALVFSSLFFVYTSASIDFTKALQLKYIAFYLAMIGAAFLGKIVGGMASSIVLRLKTVQGLRIGVGLLPRAEFCLIAAYVGYQYHLLGPEAYLAAIVIVIVTNLATPPLLKAVFREKMSRAKKG